MKERPPSAPIRIVDFDSHDTEAKQALNELWRNLCVVVHFADERANLAVGELENAVPEQRFVLAELRKGREAVCLRHALKGLIYMSTMRQRKPAAGNRQRAAMRWLAAATCAACIAAG